MNNPSDIPGEMRNATHPAGAVTHTADGGIRQHGDVNPELNSSPTGEGANLQAGDLSPELRRELAGRVSETATDVKADRADIGTE